ncbi:cell division protein FtsQ/DivIB [Amphibacillus sediminis]|uniref:cell division protein FtsQ/DivIB n=1 Tax=Amphibacillus sediminis TaxID=360185 RepID=UPI0008315C64|nr:FtsQ-type POTRA domain-containing protein [Amphibacillus sediminis]
MEDHKVVSIEDRIPKLKEARRKKTNRRLVFYLSLFFVLISIVVYLQSPLSYVRGISVSGQEYISEQQIIDYSGLTEQDNIWGFRVADIENKIEQHAEIKQAKVKRVLPNSIEIAIIELDKVAYLNEGEFFYPLLENGNKLDSVRITEWQGDAPLLFGFNEEDYLIMLTEQLKELPQTVANHISEIHWTPTDANPFTLRLFMTDGFEVRTSIRGLNQSMSNYPSIVSQLDPKQKGVIDIDVGGAVFNAYTSENEQKKDQDQLTDGDE